MANIDNGLSWRRYDIQSGVRLLSCGTDGAFKIFIKMISENVFAIIYDFIPFLFPKIRKKEKESTLNTIVFVVMEMAIFVSLVPSLLKRIHSNTSELSNFLETFNFFFYLISSALNVFFHLIPMYDSFVCLEDILKFEKSFGVERSKEIDSFLFLILLLISTNTVALMWFVPFMTDLYALNLLINIYYTFQAVGMKHMISKRVKLVVEKLLEEKEEETFALFLSLRTVLSYNTTCNKTTSFRIANGMGNGISTLLASLCAYWRVYGLHDPYDCYERNNPYLTPFVHGTAVFEMLFLATPARQISDSVSKFCWEIIRKVGNTEFSVTYREKMQVIVQEMTHTSVDITALELFTINNSSFTDACGFVITCMMVFVQFMK